MFGSDKPKKDKKRKKRKQQSESDEAVVPAVVPAPIDIQVPAQNT